MDGMIYAEGHFGLKQSNQALFAGRNGDPMIESRVDSIAQDTKNDCNYFA